MASPSPPREVTAAATTVKVTASLQESEAELPQELDLAIVPALAICCVIAAICALDRVVMSVAIIPMAADLGFSDATKGLIAASFSVGYGIGLPAVGVIAASLPAEYVLAVGLVLWSLAQVRTRARISS
jgi:MFS transporter, ACS family, solute carrier family 17 (sodium-dependent inorganic phosphate cotransporter), other